MLAVALQDKTSSLARQLARDLNSRLKLATRSSRELESPEFPVWL